ncbi:3-oxo-5-alpha-steroid 4-dehydrogenase 2-like [Saccostrea cucullata]|uniref:3-oxo-5-alpha-steroid 4-dehydrogenase 2-like n=1 Tax=Saccostrea cuccullata TaxID=36930 RepID=UPI002ED50CBF
MAFARSSHYVVGDLTALLRRSYYVSTATFIFPLRIKGGKPIPLFPFVAAVFFCSVNGALQTYGILLSNTQIHHWFQKARFCLGIMLFFTEMYINIRSDILLTSLRREKEGTYRTPSGFLFEYVSGANFLGEIVEWIGFSLACCYRGPGNFLNEVVVNESIRQM